MTLEQPSLTLSQIRDELDRAENIIRNCASLEEAEAEIQRTARPLMDAYARQSSHSGYAYDRQNIDDPISKVNWQRDGF